LGITTKQQKLLAPTVLKLKLVGIIFGSKSQCITNVQIPSLKSHFGSIFINFPVIEYTVLLHNSNENKTSETILRTVTVHLSTSVRQLPSFPLPTTTSRHL